MQIRIQEGMNAVVVMHPRSCWYCDDHHLVIDCQSEGVEDGIMHGSRAIIDVESITEGIHRQVSATIRLKLRCFLNAWNDSRVPIQASLYVVGWRFVVYSGIKTLHLTTCDGKRTSRTCSSTMVYTLNAHKHSVPNLIAAGISPWRLSMAIGNEVHYW